jgi:hypothetical protein
LFFAPPDELTTVDVQGTDLLARKKEDVFGFLLCCPTGMEESSLLLPLRCRSVSMPSTKPMLSPLWFGSGTFSYRFDTRKMWRVGVFWRQFRTVRSVRSKGASKFF